MTRADTDWIVSARAPYYEAGIPDVAFQRETFVPES